MEMKKNRINSRLPLAAAFLLATGGGAAQTLHESINVEGKYVPDIIRTDRIYAFPQARRFPLESSPMAYDWKSVPASFSPTLMTMTVTGWRTSRIPDTHRRYLDADLGSWLNSNLSAGGRFIDNDDTRAGAWLQFNSSSLEKMKLGEATADRKRFRYDGTIGLYGSHNFGEAGTLSAALNWHLGYFNYFMYLPDVADDKDPTQTLNDIALRLAWDSPVRKESLVWHAEAGLRHFGYRSLYLPTSPLSAATPAGGISGKPARETRIRAQVNLAMPWKSGSEIGADLRIDGLLYSAQSDIVYAPGITLEAPDNYGQAALTPYYRFSRGLLNVKAGAEIDLTFNAGPERSRYSLFHIAPDVSLDFRKGAAGVYLNVKGGSRLRTLADMHEENYYTLPTLSCTRPVYTPLDAALGVTFGPFAGFSAGAEIAYRISNHTDMGGWYPYILTGRGNPWSGVAELAGYTPLYGFDNEGLNVSGFSVGLNLGYTTGKVFSIKGDAHYQPQKGETGYFNGYDRARWVIDATAELNPWHTFRFSVGYEYRGVRNIYSRLENMTPGNVINGKGKDRVTALRLPDLTLLKAGVSYDITPAFGIRVDAQNLLNRHDVLLPGLPGEGLSITGGLRILF